MVELTDRYGVVLSLNKNFISALIENYSPTGGVNCHNTIIVMTNGEKYLVIETRKEILNKISYE